MPHTVATDASEHPVSAAAVTIYRKRAEVVRQFVVELEAGQSIIHVTKLPTCMDDSSLPVSGLGDAVIFRDGDIELVLSWEIVAPRGEKWVTH